MKTLLLCAVVAVCVCGTLGARRRLLAGGPPRRPVQRRPFGGPRFRDGERQDYTRGPVAGRAPPQQLRLAPRERFPQAPPPQQYDQQFQQPFRQEPIRQESREPFSREPQGPFRQEPQGPFRQEPQGPFRQEPEEPIRQESDEYFRREPQENIHKETLEPFRQEPQEPIRQEPLEAFRQETQKEFAQENGVPEKPVKKASAAEARDEFAAVESVVQKRQDFAPVADQRQAPSFSEPELAADSRQDEYSLQIPEKKEKQRLEFQVHGLQGPHSYRFGYDTGSGHNRQFRFEERDADGNLSGRYGYYTNGKLQVVNYSATDKGGFHAEGDFGKFPENSH